jgi:hypothetical protein
MRREGPAPSHEAWKRGEEERGGGAASSGGEMRAELDAELDS